MKCLGLQIIKLHASFQILLRTKELIEKSGYSVIYGDTDSVMINTGLSEIGQVKKIGAEVNFRKNVDALALSIIPHIWPINKAHNQLQIKKMINKCYKKLEIDIDGIFTKLFLLKKKKYAGLSLDLNGEHKVKLEMKGLDIVRRDWSVIAVDIGKWAFQFTHQSSNRQAFTLFWNYM